MKGAGAAGSRQSNRCGKDARWWVGTVGFAWGAKPRRRREGKERERGTEGDGGSQTGGRRR